MNKYIIISTFLLVILTFIILKLLNIKAEWYFFIIPFFLGIYNGKVLKSTLEGFNIISLNFSKGEKDTKWLELKVNSQPEDETLWFFEYKEYIQWFETHIVIDFKGNRIILNGGLSNTLGLNELALTATLSKQANHKEIIKKLKEGKVAVKVYEYGPDDYIEVIFFSYIELRV